MKNILIFLAIFAAVTLLSFSSQNKYEETNCVTIKTPSQVEMQRDMLQRTRENAKNNINKDITQPKKQNNLFNQRIIDQQGKNNHPQINQRDKF